MTTLRVTRVDPYDNITSEKWGKIHPGYYIESHLSDFLSALPFFFTALRLLPGCGLKPDAVRDMR